MRLLPYEIWIECDDGVVIVAAVIVVFGVVGVVASHYTVLSTVGIQHTI